MSGSDAHTSAQSVRPSEDPALLDLSERREHDPDVVLVALLRHHADEQLPVFHCCRAKRRGETVLVPVSSSGLKGTLRVKDLF